jgi:hypothetical protein
MQTLLPLLTILFAWRKTTDQREAVLATAGCVATFKWMSTDRMSGVHSHVVWVSFRIADNPTDPRSSCHCFK